VREIGQASDISPWTRQAGDELAADGVRDGNKNDGYCRGGALRCQSGNAIDRNQNVYLERNQFSGETNEAFWNFRWKAVLQNDVLTFDVAEITQPSSYGSEIYCFLFLVGSMPKNANSRNFCSGLRARRDRPRDR
jgi:hypothetical protein